MFTDEYLGVTRDPDFGSNSIFDFYLVFGVLLVRTVNDVADLKTFD